MTTYFPTKEAAERKAKECGFAKADILISIQGWFISNVELPQRTLDIIERHNARCTTPATPAAPVAKRPERTANAPTTRAPTSADIVRRVMSENPSATRDVVVALCVAEGVKEITAKTRYGDELRARV